LPDDPRPPPAGPFDVGPRLALYDAAREPVVSAAQMSAHYQEWPLRRGDEVIGYLRLFDAERIEGFDEIAFARSQLRFAIWAALAVLALAALSAVALAARLRAPIGRLAAATRSLAGGDYTVRVDAERGDELGQLGGDFNRLATALDDHRTARRQWGADIAHELRTPLAILRGEIQALQDGVRPLDRAALDSLEGECNRLGRLIEDLYQLSLSDAGALEYRFEAVDLAELLREQVDQRRNALAQAGLALALDLGGNDRLVVRADATRLGQLVDNLLVNAERYTDAPGKIELRLLADQRHARIVVDDSPPGVPPSALPRLFERLYRVEASRNRAAAGAGLGLAICRNIVLAHGGQIAALNSPLGGLRVVVDLPLEKSR
jgi:two-component system sensor histidine kinase BaeS